MHPSLVKWEKTLKKVLDWLDDYLENRYGSLYSLHPARRARGTTLNKSHDGLFDIVSSFTPGKGSEYGRGYIVDIHMATLDNVPENIQQEINAVVIQHLRKKLPRAFPGRNLRVDLDGNMIKIYGDLSLGEI
ncbi:MAG: hypothetical protein R6V04_13365 [bacterium]